MTEKAYAKINLYLDALGIRDDGFHDIKSIMHSIELCDELEFIIDSSSLPQIELTCDDPKLPTDKTNIVYRAAEAYLNRFNLSAKLIINIMKKIPVCAGLGGGSSDGAATLRALNRHFGLANDKELLEIAGSIGSDVPFCLIGGAALCEGRGEILTPIQPLKATHTVVAIGKERVSTPKAYSDVDRKYPDLSAREGNINVLHKLMNESLNGADIKELYNIFEEVVDLHEIGEIKKIMLSNGATTALMSGSGPSVFGFFSSRECAEETSRLLTSLGYQAFYTTTIDKI